MSIDDGNLSEVTDQESAVKRSYRMLQEMVLSFEIKPGERINESELSKKLGVSRTPLREALNRLASENFVDFVTAKGFFRKEIKTREIYDLIELRIALEVAGAKLASKNASDEAIEELFDFMQEIHNIRAMPLAYVVSLDEKFHETLAGLSGNGELLAALRSVNVRIRPIRYLAVDPERMTLGELQQKEICIALKNRQVERLEELLTVHIYRSLTEVEQAVRELYGKIYVG
ncbi:GntR family transcriptional regulator [Ciceribacter selenitireducens]